MTSQHRSELLNTLKKRRAHCAELLDLSGKQAELVESSDYTQLLEVLGRKQRVLGRLDELKQRQPDLAEQWRVARNTAPQEWCDDGEHVIAETEAILAELIEQETQSTERLTRRRDSAQKDLQAISNGSRAHEAYRDGMAPATHRALNINQ